MQDKVDAFKELKILWAFRTRWTMVIDKWQAKVQWKNIGDLW
jgi:hypothetical protein